jgi:hypothetical protein
MSISRGIITVLFSGATTVMLMLPCRTQAAQTEATAKAGGQTNAPDAEVVIPQSVFDLTAKGIKDPFYPNTLRQPIPVVAAPVTNSVPVAALSSLVLKALSGSAGQRLALINNRTLEVGETAEVTVAGGNKIKIRCVDIRESSVLVKLEGQSDPIEIHLRKGF